MTATDAYTLIVCETGEECEEFDAFTVDAKALSGIKAKKSSAFGRAVYIIDVDDDGNTAKITGDFDTWTTLRLMEQKYPDFRRLLPAGGEEFTVEPSTYNPAYVERAAKALKPFTASGMAVATRRVKCGVFEAVNGDVKVTAIVMPTRADDSALYKWKVPEAGELAGRVKQLESDKQYWMDKAERYEDMGETYHLKYEKLLQEHEELKASLASESGTREMAQDDRDELVRENNMLRERIAELEQARPDQPHEWESKTLKWYDHEVEGARQCKKEGSRNFGYWFVKKTA